MPGKQNYVPAQPNVYQGKQIVINSDRVLFNAKEDSVLVYADKSIGLNIFIVVISFYYMFSILE